MTKYGFTGESMNYKGHILRRIYRLSDRVVGGWIEKEENLSQDGECWVRGVNAKVYDDAKVEGNATIYGSAKIYGNARIYGDAIVSEDAEVFGDAKVFGDASVKRCAEIYGRAKVYDNAKVYGDAKVYGNAEVYGSAEVYGDAEVRGKAKVYSDTKIHGNTIIGEDDFTNKELTAITQDFIYKIDNSNKFEVKTEYSSIDEYFNSAYQNDSKLDTLIICTVDTKIPIIKLEKIEKDKQLKYKFIVDLTTENEEHFLIQSFIETKEQLSQKLTQTIDALNQYPEFSKYVDDLENCL